MAVPKRKMSRSNTRSRRAQWKTTAVPLEPCSNRACRQPKPQHVACPACGQYNGRQVTQPA
ncbi:50S ribosomal protein L32 [Actinocrispum wychmicini]|uniref:Large ribosomal subunit protein bL32 n=1 Tax=Actinocrispum wychmicini TaxID=1213861 RepID=A0A4R2JKD7_9PSEU|nr:50S ribosomal protein L32 [Actinocrispum wychmicini]TCO57009.1 large subunit ribosomal protein L32 [Actinocrispum wychmicini]